MRICAVSNFYNNTYNYNNSKNKHIALNKQSDNNCFVKSNRIITPAFGTKIKVDTNNIFYKKITEAGFSLFNQVKILDPKGKFVDGYSFIKDSGKENLISMITDKNFQELGHVGMSESYEGIYQGAWCSVVNNTAIRKDYATDFRTPNFEFFKSKENGHYKLVATRAYEQLIEYIKLNKPHIKRIKINALTEGSWNYHKKLGFVDSGQDEFDSYAYINMLSKKINYNEEI